MAGERASTKSTRQTVDCNEMERTGMGAQRTVHLLHNSEQPASVFSILDTGTKTIPLVADGLFDKLMQKMTSMYTSKKQTKIEAKGPRFEIGDFCVKLGSVTMSQNFKGVLVETDKRASERLSDWVAKLVTKLLIYDRKKTALVSYMFELKPLEMVVLDEKGQETDIPGEKG
uniref:Mediator of RNA polymerase II transcription subunit 20 n=1 Tax=Timema cristinae TaxID=61476 RepID=A0A7R9D5H9_TIMCR|nr:unnamed protein product [Timema cristinae]